jgi:hypothetical protein
MGSKGSAVKWLSQLAIPAVILFIGFILIFVVIPTYAVPKTCPAGQEEAIQQVEDKANGLKGKPGYETVYFEVKKDCVTSIEIANNGRTLKIHYKSLAEGETYDYKTSIEWDTGTLYANTYALRVYANSVELMRRS